jgi:cyanophycinase-like exopeptidase
VAYVGVASNDDRGFLKWIAAPLREAGAGQVRLAPMAATGADLDEARSVLSTSDLIFMSGGDVEAGMRILRERKMLSFLKRLQLAGRVFFGISAGSIMLARQWVHWPDPANDTAEVFDCMKVAPLLCDTHAEAEDWEELKTLLLLTRAAAAIGYGIPSGGALRITPTGTVSALGKPLVRFRAQTGAIVPLPPLVPVP